MGVGKFYGQDGFLENTASEVARIVRRSWDGNESRQTQRGACTAARNDSLRLGKFPAQKIFLPHSADGVSESSDRSSCGAGCGMHERTPGSIDSPASGSPVARGDGGMKLGCFRWLESDV